MRSAVALASCLQPTDAFYIVPVPSNPRVGQEVTLSVRDARNPTVCFWFRGAQYDNNRKIFHAEVGRVISTGPSYTGREGVTRDCSLTIRNVQASDSGEYLVVLMEGYQFGNFKYAVGRLQVSN
ncbi:carcinoembryonic antigen-related cell adhesion molecule 16-like isoform X2 [Hemicordylus capensis]|uniref:carcinoembryonic antigen-related cell adhesion molecule 16-like isoform X2 n=1 Tax=Hemicordylus capensis TaxID=884348 RepID=UPI002303B2C4|nr:carcinoembryonic antigen-related cell adhesion molecule 16-like isoform X2 [Hemicordylus capensis]